VYIISSFYQIYVRYAPTHHKSRSVCVPATTAMWPSRVHCPVLCSNSILPQCWWQRSWAISRRCMHTLVFHIQFQDIYWLVTGSVNALVGISITDPLHQLAMSQARVSSRLLVVGHFVAYWCIRSTRYIREYISAVKQFMLNYNDWGKPDWRRKLQVGMSHSAIRGILLRKCYCLLSSVALYRSIERMSLKDARIWLLQIGDSL
jgi:hypothetical protein